jgi:lysophospholipase L1-like esterase
MSTPARSNADATCVHEPRRITAALGRIAAIVAVAVLWASAPAHAALVSVSPADPHVQLQGRWNRSASADTTVNSGSRLLLRFTGTDIVALFDTTSITNPAKFYVRIDSGPPKLYVVDRPMIDLANGQLSLGAHLLELDVRDVDERANRWIPPLQSGLILTGFQLSNGGQTLPPPPLSARRMLFLGDSITQGVRAVGPQIGPDGADATKDYAWLVGHALDSDFQQVGFGAQGITHGGGGNVPAAADSLPFNYQGSPIDPSFVPDGVVVNQGTNDSAASSQVFLPAYQSFLQEIRSRWPEAWIFAMRPFNGTHAADIAAAVTALHDARIVYVDTTGWLAQDEFTDGLHPTVAGHLAVARRLESIVASRLHWTTTPLAKPQTHLLAAGSAPGFESGDEFGWRPESYITDLAVSSAIPPNGAAPYDGTYALDTTSTVAPLNEWRTIELVTTRPLRLKGTARDVFAYVSIPSGTTSFYDAKLKITGSGGKRRSITYNIPNLTGFLPWDRIHVNLKDWGPNSTISTITISVRGEGSSTGQALPFQVDDIGYTNQTDG